MSGRGRGRGRGRARDRSNASAPGRARNDGQQAGVPSRETADRQPLDSHASLAATVTGILPTVAGATSPHPATVCDSNAPVGISRLEQDRSERHTQRGRQIANGPAQDRVREIAAEAKGDAKGATTSSRPNAPSHTQSASSVQSPLRSSVTSPSAVQNGRNGKSVSPPQTKPVPAAILSSSSSALVASSQTSRKSGNPDRKPPLRPDFGRAGTRIALSANRFKVTLSDKLTMIHHYDVKFDPPELKPAKISWKIIETWSTNYKKELGGIRPVFDGKANLYTSRLLPNKEVL